MQRTLHAAVVSLATTPVPEVAIAPCNAAQWRQTGHASCVARLICATQHIVVFVGGAGAEERGGEGGFCCNAGINVVTSSANSGDGIAGVYLQCQSMPCWRGPWCRGLLLYALQRYNTQGCCERGSPLQQHLFSIYICQHLHLLNIYVCSTFTFVMAGCASCLTQGLFNTAA